MTDEEYWNLPQENRDWAYLSNLVDKIAGNLDGFAGWLKRLERAAHKQVAQPIKYYPEMDQMYCPECGLAVYQNQHYCDQCGQKIKGTHIYDIAQYEEIHQKPVIDNETGFVDWGEEEDNDI